MQVLGIMLLIVASRSFGGDGEKFWVFFTDKTHEVCLHDTVECHLLPPDHNKINKIEELGVTIVNKSNWLNAVSVVADASQREQIVNLDFVDRVTPVKRLIPTHHQSGDHLFPIPEAVSATFSQAFERMSLSQNYGPSAAQLQFHRIDKVHELGYDGADVIVGVMDGGFDSSHEVFDHLRISERILAERDFVDGGSNTKQNVVDPTYHSHGTSVAAIIAGKKDGTLMGVAPGVSLVLARTEDDKQEAPIEEDNWVAAIEWMQTLGVQIVNSSLGYNIFTSQPMASYTYDDMDGKTSAIAKAATKAASVFNMVVVVSAGNEGNTSWKYITTPADADSIITVGSLTSTGSRINSSSVGPTSDGRIKPDVSARGACVFSAASTSSNSYTNCISGTSFASPHVAGMMALALQARPGMPAIWYVRQAQKASSLYPNPNNLIGYGKIDALDLISGVTTSISLENPNQLPDDAFITRNFPNPFNPSTTIFYQVPSGWFLKDVRIYDVTGRAVSKIQHNDISATGTMQWNGYSMVGAKVASGIYFARFNFTNGVASKVLMHPMSFIK
jgi:serine protease AprX